MEVQKTQETKPETQQTDKQSGSRGTSSGQTTADPLLNLQAAIGNRAVGRFLQAKLTISEPGDAFEQEADRVADQVMRMADPNGDEPCGIGRASSSSLQRSCSRCEEEKEETEPPGEQNTNLSRTVSSTLQRVCSKCEEEEEEQELHRKAQGASETNRNSEHQARSPETQIDNLRGGGEPLSESLRAYFEPRFGYDFSHVRVHWDSRALESAQSVNALAYTMGHDVVFGSGQYAPDTDGGKRLLAHELTHVIQQRAAPQSHSKTAAYHQPSYSPTATLQRQADISRLPPALPCVAVQGPGHPAGTDLLFTGGGRTLTPAHQTDIGTFFTAWTTAGGTSDISIDGFSSDVGLQRDNWQLSCDRAQAAKSELVSRGVASAKITTFAHGASTEYSATAGLNRRAVVHSSGLLTPADRTIDRAQVGGDADTIFFDRTNPTVTEPTQLSKISPLASANSGTALTLFGFVSEDENVPAATGTTLATARIADVSVKLNTAGHTNPRTPDVSQTGFGSGQIDYRDMRKVKVKPAGGSSGVQNCAAGSLVACSPLTRFTDAQTRANALLTPVITALGPPVTGAAVPLFDARFGTTAANRASVAALVKTNLTNLQPHVTAQMSLVSVPGPPPTFTPGPGHRCTNACDAGCEGSTTAYNNDVDASATVTLCDTPRGFMSSGLPPDERAGTLIHEGLHGITLATGPIAPAVGPSVTEPGATDFSYHEQRLISFIDPATAVKNNDSYLIFVLQVNGLPVSVGRTGVVPAPAPDVASGAAMAPGQRLEVDRALAWLEAWLIWAEQETSNLYATIHESIPAGSWTNSYYEEAMRLLAPRFGLTLPPTVPPQSEKFVVSAIHERLERMSGVLYNVRALTINRVTPGATSWSAGPAFTVTIGDDFFALSAGGRTRAQLELLLRRIVEATTGVSAGAVSRYIDLVNQIRIHHGGGAP